MLRLLLALLLTRRFKANIDAEATTRGNADTTLQTNIDTEASTREAADDVLTAAIVTEAATRASEDACT